MASEHIEFVPSEPLAGVKRFFTTNGRASFNDDDQCFYLQDACMLLRVDSKAWTTSYIERPKDLYFGQISIVGNRLDMELYSGYSGSVPPQSIPMNEVQWIDGLGPAQSGEFPSAYEPWVAEQELLR